MTTPAQLVLGELIQRLAAEPREKKLRVGFTDPCSYRGFYEELAFCRAEDVTVGEMLDAARSAVGSTFEGYKGGEYTMGEHSPVWLVADAGYGGETLGAVLLDALLRDVAPNAPAHPALLAERDALATDFATALSALRDSNNPEEGCELDHNGNCQAHWWFPDDLHKPPAERSECPDARAKRLLARYPENTEGGQ